MYICVCVKYKNICIGANMEELLHNKYGTECGLLHTRMALKWIIAHKGMTKSEELYTLTRSKTSQSRLMSDRDTAR